MTGFIETIPTGTLLFDEYIAGAGLTKYRVAKATGISPAALGQICSNKRAITPIVDLRLCTFFGLTPGFFLRLQVLYQTAQITREMGMQVKKEVFPLKLAL